MFMHSVFLLSIGLLCLSADAQTDASQVFDQAAARISPSPSSSNSFQLTPQDQAIVDGFFAPQPKTQNLFTGDSTQSYGLAPQFNMKGPNALKRLTYPSTGTLGYGTQPISNYGAATMSCGLGYVSNYFTGRFVGIGNAYYNQGYSCGRCIKIQCDDISCKEPGKTVVAEVVDLCGECYEGDLNIAGPLFKELSGRDPHPNPSLALSWEIADCSHYINSTIKMLVKPQGSAYYQAFNFANSRQPIIAVQVNGDLLKHETNNYWSWNPSKGAINPRGPFDFALLGANRQILRVRLPRLVSSDLKVQFAATPEPTPAPSNATSATISSPVAEAPIKPSRAASAPSKN